MTRYPKNGNTNRTSHAVAIEISRHIDHELVPSVSLLYFQIQELARNVGITDENEIKIMVNFYHDLGLLIHYGSSGTIDNVLRNTVVLQPHWLVNMFRAIVMARPKSEKVCLLFSKMT
jgi:hypothetical protein